MPRQFEPGAERRDPYRTLTGRRKSPGEAATLRRIAANSESWGDRTRLPGTPGVRTAPFMSCKTRPRGGRRLRPPRSSTEFLGRRGPAEDVRVPERRRAVHLRGRLRHVI